MFHSTMIQQIGKSFDVRTIIQDINCKAVASAIPANVLVNAWTLYPLFGRFAVILTRWKIEYGGILIIW